MEEESVGLAHAAPDPIGDLITELAVTFAYTHVPTIVNPAKEDVHKAQLRWRCRLLRHGRSMFTFKYSAGIGHCPSYPKGKYQLSMFDADLICQELATGCKAKSTPGGYILSSTRKILPVDRDVLHCLVLDCDVLQHADFESWAADFGYAVDSRKAHATYRGCRKQSQRMLAAFGFVELQRLRDAFANY